MCWWEGDDEQLMSIDVVQWDAMMMRIEGNVMSMKNKLKQYDEAGDWTVTEQYDDTKTASV